MNSPCDGGAVYTADGLSAIDSTIQRGAAVVSPRQHPPVRVQPCTRSEARAAFAIFATQHIPPPPFIVRVPIESVLETGLDPFQGLESEFRCNLRGIHRVAPIVSWTIGDRFDEALDGLLQGGRTLSSRR